MEGWMANCKRGKYIRRKNKDIRHFNATYAWLQPIRFTDSSTRWAVTRFEIGHLYLKILINDSNVYADQALISEKVRFFSNFQNGLRWICDFTSITVFWSYTCRGVNFNFLFESFGNCEKLPRVKDFWSIEIFWYCQLPIMI